MTLDRWMKRLATFCAGGAALLAALPALAAPLPETGWGMPRDVSVDGHLIDWLINVTSVFVVLLFVITVAWMLVACLKHGERHVAEYDHGNSKHSLTVAL